MFLSALFFICQNPVSAQSDAVYRLRDVKTIFVDEDSFKITFSSCGREIGSVFVPCEKDNLERQKFLEDLRRWLGKYDFALTSEREKADAVLRGEIYIDDDTFRKKAEYDREQKKKHPHLGHGFYEPKWSVTAWLENQNGSRLWRNTGYAPQVSYKPSGLAKIEAKKLARHLQYNFKKSK